MDFFLHFSSTGLSSACWASVQNCNIPTPKHQIKLHWPDTWVLLEKCIHLTKKFRLTKMMMKRPSPIGQAINYSQCYGITSNLAANIWTNGVNYFWWTALIFIQHFKIQSIPTSFQRHWKDQKVFKIAWDYLKLLEDKYLNEPMK